MEKLKARAALRNVGLRPSIEPSLGWELENAFTVLASGTLEDIEAWLTRTDPEK
ncbi:hypothetical protein [Nocardia mangyaensis]|uniref:hypothetical protein n=1 Tax=Nocardia mangyaensis TaxID=2213200 RepID=UPI0026761612|nr:hypothetical protein [Nocardia mangyaensis]MDO3645715.1 hypothetical protein [Nocardia mangyaensis]